MFRYEIEWVILLYIITGDCVNQYNFVDCITNCYYISVISIDLSEIYRIVSQKQLPDSPGGNKPGGSGTTPITISSTVDNNQPAKKPCCN